MATPIDTSGNVGLATSLAIDNADKVHISYYSDTINGEYGNLRYATNKSGSWEITSIDLEAPPSIGYASTSIAIDSNDKVHISYHDNTYNELYYATNVDVGWTYDFVDTNGMYNSLGIDSKDKVYISYCVFDENGFTIRCATW